MALPRTFFHGVQRIGVFYQSKKNRNCADTIGTQGVEGSGVGEFSCILVAEPSSMRRVLAIVAAWLLIAGSVGGPAWIPRSTALPTLMNGACASYMSRGKRLAASSAPSYLSLDSALRTSWPHAPAAAPTCPLILPLHPPCARVPPAQRAHLSAEPVDGA